MGVMTERVVSCTEQMTGKRNLVFEEIACVDQVYALKIMCER